MLRQLFRAARDTALRPLFNRYESHFQLAYYEKRFAAWCEDRRQEAGFNDYPNPAPAYAERTRLYEYLCGELSLAEQPICYLEFGVAEGDAIKWWLARNGQKDSIFVGFDSFQGLPESWDHKEQSAFTRGGEPPQVSDERCSFVVGYFQQTVTDFLRQRGESLGRPLLVHLDADLYSSTLYLLFALLPYLRGGDILIFDEFSSALHEFKALLDFQSATSVEYSLLGAVNNYRQIAIKILSTEFHLPE